MSVSRQAAKLVSVAIACTGFLAGAVTATAAPAAAEQPRAPRVTPVLVSPADAPATREAQPRLEPAARVVDWAVATRDNGQLPFIVIDKGKAELMVLTASGRLLARTPVLIGTARGDDTMPGIGELDLSRIPEAARTTPAGRFLARLGPAEGQEKLVLWVDYDSAVAIHPVITSNPSEQRVARLQSATPADNRITFGCINIEADVFHQVIEPLFRREGGMVYILPETRPLNTVFARIPGEQPRANTASTFAEAFAEYRLERPPARPR